MQDRKAASDDHRSSFQRKEHTMFEPTLRSGLAGLLCVLAAGIAACDARDTVRSAAQATEAWSDHGKVVVWPGLQQPHERTSAARPESAGAPRADSAAPVAPVGNL
jgi:hypothetical protein